jgi:hypothetical protein
MLLLKGFFTKCCVGAYDERQLFTKKDVRDMKIEEFLQSERDSSPAKDGFTMSANCQHVPESLND